MYRVTEIKQPLDVAEKVQERAQWKALIIVRQLSAVIGSVSIQNGIATLPSGETLNLKPLEADRVEVWGSSFTDEGPDFCEFIFYKGEEEVDRYRKEGY